MDSADTDLAVSQHCLPAGRKGLPDSGLVPGHMGWPDSGLVPGCMGWPDSGLVPVHMGWPDSGLAPGCMKQTERNPVADYTELPDPTD